MRLIVFFLVIAFAVSGFDEPAPTQEQQQAILGNIGSFVEAYTNTLPNLICERTTEQYKGNKEAQHWHQLDTLTSRLTLVNGAENSTLERVNNKPVKDVRKAWRRALSTEGEFGSMLTFILSQGANADVKWDRWATLNGKRVAVFDYAIDKDHSRLRLSFSDLVHAVVPYGGSIYADPATGTVWRMTDHITEIPVDLQTLDMQTTIDYGEVAISGKTYVLPVHATVLDRNVGDSNRNEITFSDYRKFEAKSTITFQ